MPRADGLPQEIQRLLLIACEAPDFSDAPPAEVVRSTNLFRNDSKQFARCSKKVLDYRILRENKPDVYWQRVRSAQIAFMNENHMSGTPGSMPPPHSTGGSGAGGGGVPPPAQGAPPPEQGVPPHYGATGGVPPPAQGTHPQYSAGGAPPPAQGVPPHYGATGGVPPPAQGAHPQYSAGGATGGVPPPAQGFPPHYGTTGGVPVQGAGIHQGAASFYGTPHQAPQASASPYGTPHQMPQASASAYGMAPPYGVPTPQQIIAASMSNMPPPTPPPRPFVESLASMTRILGRPPTRDELATLQQVHQRDAQIAMVSQAVARNSNMSNNLLVSQSLQGVSQEYHAPTQLFPAATSPAMGSPTFPATAAAGSSGATESTTAGSSGPTESAGASGSSGATESTTAGSSSATESTAANSFGATESAGASGSSGATESTAAGSTGSSGATGSAGASGSSTTPTETARETPRKKSAAKSASKGKTPRKSSKKKKSSSKKDHPKELPAIPPSFAMAVRDGDSGDMLAIGEDKGNWIFDLKEHVQKIHDTHPGRDLYLVGYRDEERPNLFGGSERVNVPFFAVHTLEAGKRAPESLVIKDLENKTEEKHSIATSSAFQWTLLHAFPMGEKVHILDFVGRSSKRSSQSQASLTCGGYVYFSKPFDYKQNPGESFKISLGGETYYLDDDIWDWAKSGVKAAIGESEFDNLEHCYRSANKGEFLSILLPSIVDSFFEYHDISERADFEEQVSAALGRQLWDFKKSVDHHESVREATDAKVEDALHFKIYPENEEIHKYIGDGCDYLSSYAGKAAAVYPVIEETEPVEDD